MQPPGASIHAARVARSLRFTYFAYFASVGLEYVYIPYYFAALGFGPGEIGLLFTGRILMTLVLQPFITGWSDRLGLPHAFLKVGMFGGFLAGAALVWTGSFAAAAAAFWSQALLRSSAIPLLDATSIRTAGSEGFGRLRRWGSLGYGLSVAAMGAVALDLSHDLAGLVAVQIYAVVLAAAALGPLTLPRDDVAGRGGAAGHVERILSLPLAAFLLWNCLHWWAVESFNVFFSLRVRELGLSSALPGAAVFTSIAAEVLALSVMPRVLARWGAWRLILAALAVSTARWLATALTHDPYLLVALQAAHAFSFGVWYASALDLLGRFAPLHRRAALQGVFVAAVLGAGGVMSTATGGWIMESFGGAAVFAGAAAVEALALLAALASRRLWAGQSSKKPAT